MTTTCCGVMGATLGARSILIPYRRGLDPGCFRENTRTGLDAGEGEGGARTRIAGIRSHS